MAKRAPVDEAPYRPLLDPGVISAALMKTGTGTAQAKPEGQGTVTRVVEMPRPEASRFQPLQRSEASETQAPKAGFGEARTVPNDLVEKFDQEKRILLTRSEAASLDRLVSALAGRLNAQVKLSHVLRSLIGLLLNAESEVDRRAGEVPLLIRPANGDGKALQRFESEIAKILCAAIRDAGPVR